MKLKMLDGKMIEATDMNFKIAKEDWNSYELDDGTMVKLKTSPTRIFRLEITDPVTGQHEYYVQHITSVAVSEPEE